MSELIPGISGFFTGSMGWLGSTMVYVGYILLFALIAGGFFGIYFLMQYKRKAIIVKVSGSGVPDFPYSVGKIVSDRIRVLKTGTWIFLFSRRKMEPIDSKHIYPGNKILLFDINGEFVPGKINCNKDALSISPIPYSVRRKAELELQQAAQDYEKQDFWTQNKTLLMGLAAVAICCVFAGFVLWLSFKKTDSVVPALNTLTDAVSNMNNIAGAPR